MSLSFCRSGGGKYGFNQKLYVVGGEESIFLGTRGMKSGASGYTFLNRQNRLFPHSSTGTYPLGILCDQLFNNTHIWVGLLVVLYTPAKKVVT